MSNQIWRKTIKTLKIFGKTWKAWKYPSNLGGKLGGKPEKLGENQENLEISKQTLEKFEEHQLDLETTKQTWENL